MLHIDKVTIERYVAVKNDHGGTEEEKIIVAEDLACRLHQKTLSAPIDGDDARSYQTYTLYASEALDIQQNDSLTVKTPQGEVYHFRASKPFRYPITNHMEVALEEESSGGDSYA